MAPTTAMIGIAGMVKMMTTSAVIVTAGADAKIVAIAEIVGTAGIAMAVMIAGRS